MLFGLIGSHTILETARDALFLSSIPATRLPIVYVAIAIVSLVVTEAQTRFGRGLNRRASLCVWTLFSAGVTAVFWRLAGGESTLSLYALYIWSGMVTTLVLIHFWTLLGEIFSITQAKRVYGIIGAGSVAGAIVGSAAAAALTRMVHASHLLLVAAGGLAITSAVPLLFERVTKCAETAGASRGEAPSASLIGSASFIARHRYARRIVALTLLGAVAVTLGDFLFKATAAEIYTEPDELARFFASVYLVLNALSLFVQIALAGVLIRWLNVTTAVAVLPLLLTGGGVAMVLVAGLPAALAIKGADGALKHSLHRTASELLYVPLSAAARASVKAFSEVVGQRGGQSLASIAILGLAAIGAPMWTIAVALVAVSGVWLLAAATARGRYVGLFRGRIAGRRVRYLDRFPELDVASLETLIATLDGDNDAQVVAAMEVLVRENKPHLIPALILYHPSPEVVRHALAIFTATKRTSALHVIDRILDHPDPEVRIAAIGARSVIDLDERALRLKLSDEESPEVRAAIMVNLIASRAIVGSDAADNLDAILEHGSPATKLALADAIGQRAAADFDDTLRRLAGDRDLEVKIQAAAAMEQVGLADDLVALLIDESIRSLVSGHLASLGDAGLRAAARALASKETPILVRRELPRVLSIMEPARAAEVIFERLSVDPDGLVRYRLLRALERLVKREPMLQLDLEALDRAIEQTVARAYRYLDRRLSLERGATEVPARKTEGHVLLVDMLDDKRVHAIERAFKLLALARPEGDFMTIYRSLQSGRADLRASGVELCENLLKNPLRAALVGLVDDRPDAERLAAGREYHEPLDLDYSEQLERMLASSSITVRDVTIFHIGELGLAGFRPRLLELAGGASSDEVARALSRVGETDEEVALAE